MAEATQEQQQQPQPQPQLREIPGSYGWPILGAIADRQEFFRKGTDAFFRDRVRRHGSTVVRLNMPPGPPIASDPRVIALLDAKSFPVLFDVTKVDKTDVFTGTFMPSTAFTGGFRVLSFLDPSELRHRQLKEFLFSTLRSRSASLAPEFACASAAMFDQFELDLAEQRGRWCRRSGGGTDFNSPAEHMALQFLFRTFMGVRPAEGGLGRNGPTMIKIWLLCQLGPLKSFGLPVLLEDLALRTFRLPFALARPGYERLFAFFRKHAESALAEAEDLFGVARDEACHNLLYNVCFNTWGGTLIVFPALVHYVGRAGASLHADLAREIRAAVKASAGGTGAVAGTAETAAPLLASTVWEVFRICPPVVYQYARAKQDLLVESHDGVFRVKSGEMLFGYQPFATHDGRVFERPDEFEPRRFVGDRGRQLLLYVFWSNGRETESPSAANKQCAGRDFVLLMARLLLMEIFMRYDSFQIESKGAIPDFTVSITSLVKASF